MCHQVARASMHIIAESLKVDRLKPWLRQWRLVAVALVLLIPVRTQGAARHLPLGLFVHSVAAPVVC